jgi:hypothetical protein
VKDVITIARIAQKRLMAGAAVAQIFVCLQMQKVK